MSVIGASYIPLLTVDLLWAHERFFVIPYGVPGDKIGDIVVERVRAISPALPFPRIKASIMLLPTATPGAFKPTTAVTINLGDLYRCGTQDLGNLKHAMSVIYTRSAQSLRKIFDGEDGIIVQISNDFEKVERFDKSRIFATLRQLQSGVGYCPNTVNVAHVDVARGHHSFVSKASVAAVFLEMGLWMTGGASYQEEGARKSVRTLQLILTSMEHIMECSRLVRDEGDFAGGITTLTVIDA